MIRRLWIFAKLSADLLDLEISLILQQIHCFHHVKLHRNKKSAAQFGSKYLKVNFSNSDSGTFHVEGINVCCKHSQKLFETPQKLKFILVATRYEV